MRFFITGPTGSGKTTLARYVSAKLNVPMWSLDDLHWVRNPNGDYRRAPEDRTSMLESITSQSAWVVEGVQFKWADSAIEHADCIIVLDLPRWRNLMLIARRFVHRRCSGDPDRRGSFAALRREHGWHRDYHHHERTMLLAKMQPWGGKVIIVSSPANAISQMEANWPSHPAPA